ncbi:hypothetical protein QN277_025208 [Acacia crassicarpa]|uniref:Chlorophyll synthase n=1 Tax=Acacia crassicarpa TaxID=499986 RepID=A0AAE1JID3_9FABA|nr:hypothetical protein QN277_025208 [Acacia crassicarpa]
MASILSMASVSPQKLSSAITRRVHIRAILVPISFSFPRRRLTITAAGSDANEVKFPLREKAPVKTSSSSDPLLGTKGTPQETDKWKIHLQLTKPVSWLILVWGVVCGAAASGHFHWNLEDVAKSFVCMMMSGPFLTGYTQTLNAWYDREIDAIAEPYRPIPSGAIHGNEVIIQIWVLLAGGLALAGILDIWAGHSSPIVFYLAVGGSLLSFIYSSPPLKLKQNGWIGNLTLGARYISYPWWTGQAFFGTLTLNAVILTLLYSISGFGFAIIEDIKRIERDTTVGLQSLPVAFGIDTAKWICVGAIDIAQLFVTGYLLWIGKPYYALALLALIIPQIYFQFQYFLKDPVKYDVDYQTSALPFFVLGLLVTAFATSH